MADVVDHPLGDEEFGQLGQAPGGKTQVVIDRAGQGDLLDLPALRLGELGWSAPEYFAANESNPSALKLWMTSLTRSSDVKAILAMAGTSIALGRPEHDLGSSPSHHRARPPTHDREELSPLLVGDIPDCHAFCHGTTLRDRPLKVVDAPHQRCRSRH